ncbi:Polygalacturonase inhibitor 1 [Acorus calamus]|uniref:Polygalacturonase inhibitor 1 n=1 Tax=Acorus calamus TaxID=4465 RepID=A0AAV9C0L0_ACOCL|nr:Polygalacturonase inhibitor 1 [Acorus calamus]
MESLDLSYNSLTGSIPSSLGNLRNLIDLSLDRNHLTGPIPASLGDIPGLQGLSLAHNNLSGPVPATFSNLQPFFLALFRNQLSGDPSFLFGLTFPSDLLINLDLSRNLFEFNLTDTVFPAGLNGLDLSHNRIYGKISPAATKVEWVGFNVSYNRLCGEIPYYGGLSRFDKYSFFHNKCLCGLPLEPCKVS